MIFALLLSNECQGQEHAHDHAHKNEIGIANAPVYFIGEKVISYGLHLHYVRSISDSHFGIGLGYERIFDEHKHNTIGIVGSYRPTDQFSLNISPGVSFEGTENSDLIFALHLESSYEWVFDQFHLGPVVEYAYDQEDQHISLGLHVGYGF